MRIVTPSRVISVVSPSGKGENASASCGRDAVEIVFEPSDSSRSRSAHMMSPKMTTATAAIDRLATASIDTLPERVVDLPAQKRLQWGYIRLSGIIGPNSNHYQFRTDRLFWT